MNSKTVHDGGMAEWLNKLGAQGLVPRCPSCDSRNVGFAVDENGPVFAQLWCFCSACGLAERGAHFGHDKHRQLGDWHR